ncbi:MAG: NADH-quinone oxidoreductase subunit NuoE [bacterium]
METIIREILNKHKNGNLISILKEVQDRRLYLSNEIMHDVARELNVSYNDVYEIATFYSFLSTKPLGQNVIMICKSTPCFLKNCDVIIKTVENELGIKPGEMTSDGKFSLHLTNCIGACDKSPAMLINKNVYGNLTVDKVAKILDKMK